VFVTSQGSAYARFRRALLTQNLTMIDAAARELPTISLDDALTIVTLLAKKHDPRYGRAAARWVARVVLERRLELGDARRLLSLVDELPRTPGLEITLKDYT